jgi:hypothetical protein
MNKQLEDLQQNNRTLCLALRNMNFFVSQNWKKKIIHCHEACVKWGYLMSWYCRLWWNNGKCGDTLLGVFWEHFERIQCQLVGRGHFTANSQCERKLIGDELWRSEIWKKKDFYSNLLDFIAIQHHNNKEGLVVGVGDCVCCVSKSTVHMNCVLVIQWPIWQLLRACPHWTPASKCYLPLS